MIKINLEGKKEKIEEKFWGWFEKYCLDEFLKVLNKDTELQKIVFKTNSKYNDWISENLKIKEKSKKDYSEIKNFFFSPPQHHIELSKKKFNIKKSTKKFFINKYKNGFRKRVASEIVEILGINTCPYCNKNFIDIYVNKSKEKKFNGDMDHYLTKNKYPYLAICLYNLIPSCKSCNQEKGNNSDDKLHFHPYRDDSDLGYIFKTEFDWNNIDLNYIYGVSDSFKIKLDCNGNEFMKNSKEIFNLEDKYNNSKRQAKSIIRNAYIYNKRYIRDMLKDYFSENKEVYNLNLICEEEIVKIIFDYEEEDEINRPLGKLKYDLLNEFGVIKK